MDKTRSNREQNLAEWARPQLKVPRKLTRILDPRLEGQYSEIGAEKAAELAYDCLSHRPKARPTMSMIVDILKPLADFTDIPVGTFVYTAPTEHKKSPIESPEKEAHKDDKKDIKGHHHHHQHERRHHRTKSPIIYKETDLHENLSTKTNSPE